MLLSADKPRLILKCRRVPAPRLQAADPTTSSGLFASEQPQLGAKVLKIHIFSFLVGKIPHGPQRELQLPIALGISAGTRTPWHTSMPRRWSQQWEVPPWGPRVDAEGIGAGPAACASCENASRGGDKGVLCSSPCCRWVCRPRNPIT